MKWNVSAESYPYQSGWVLIAAAGRGINLNDQKYFVSTDFE